MNNHADRAGIAYKDKILEVFRAFIKICESYNLSYFCHGGTAIGVVRHQGLIPWDDDIDVLMPRPDYERFIQVFSEIKPGDYELVVPGREALYYLPFAKMCAVDTTLVEFAHIPYVLGAYIDIFPLDGASSINEQRAADWLSFRRTANKLMVLPKSSRDNFSWFWKRVFKFHFRTAWYEIECAFNKAQKYKKIHERLLYLMTRHPYDKADYVGSFGSQFGVKAFWPKEWFDGYIIKSFEGIEVRVPSGYHKLLTQVYGDYMKLPPVKDRVSQHEVAYLNLNERKSFDNINKSELKLHDY